MTQHLEHRDYRTGRHYRGFAVLMKNIVKEFSWVAVVHLDTGFMYFNVEDGLWIMLEGYLHDLQELGVKVKAVTFTRTEDL